MNKLYFIAFAALMLAPHSAPAAECDPTTTEAWLDTAAVAPGTNGAARVYAVNELCPVGADCLGAFWIYAESNGIDGLQRDDAVRDDTCDGRIQPDTLAL